MINDNFAPKHAKTYTATALHETSIIPQRKDFIHLVVVPPALAGKTRDLGMWEEELSTTSSERALKALIVGSLEVLELTWCKMRPYGVLHLRNGDLGGTHVSKCGGNRCSPEAREEGCFTGALDDREVSLAAGATVGPTAEERIVLLVVVSDLGTACAEAPNVDNMVACGICHAFFVGRISNGNKKQTDKDCDS